MPNDAQYGVEPPETWGSIGVSDISTSVPTLNGNYPRFYRQLAQALHGVGSAPVDPRDAVAVLKVIEIARQQQKTSVSAAAD